MEKKQVIRKIIIVCEKERERGGGGGGGGEYRWERERESVNHLEIIKGKNTERVI